MDDAKGCCTIKRQGSAISDSVSTKCLKTNQPFNNFTTIYKMGNIRVSFLLLGLATLVNSYGYKYQYNPASKECQLMLSVPGKRDPISFSGSTTDSRYSSNYGGVGASSNSYYNQGQTAVNAYDPDTYRPVVSAANSNINNYYEQSLYEKEREIEREKEKQKELEKDIQRELERERQKEIERERQKELEREREREIQRELERERQKELERERQKEIERERQKELEREREREIQRELERQKAVERERQKELEREREREIQKELERERERERQKELERERQKELEREREREIQKELEKERRKELEREVQRELDRKREQERERQRERERERERESEYESSSSYEQNKKVSTDYENRYPSSSSTSVSYEEPYGTGNTNYARPSTSSNYNPYAEPEDIYNKNKNYVEASSSLNANKQAQQQSSQTLQESGYGGNRVSGTSSLNNYNSRLPGSSPLDESPYAGTSDRYSPSLSPTRLCTGGKVYSDSLGRCVEKIITATSSNKKTSSSSTQQASNYNEESTSYGSSGSGVSSLGSASPLPAVAKLPDYDFNEAVLTAHNNYRAKHGVSALVLDESMSYAAQRHAVRLASGAAFEHSNDAKSGKFGENIALRSGNLSPSAVTNIWYKEHLNYDYSFPELNYSPKRSNVRFTALIWKGTSKLGVGKAISADGKTYVVANYWPPGNYESLLTENVFPPIY